MATAGDGEPVVLPAGDVLIPGSSIPLLLEGLRRVAGLDGRLHPRLEEVVAALRVGAVRFRQRDTHLRALEARAGGVVGLVGALPAVPPSVAELTVADVAGRLGMTPQGVRKALAVGQLCGRKVGGLWWVTGESVEEFRRRG